MSVTDADLLEALDRRVGQLQRLVEMWTEQACDIENEMWRDPKTFTGARATQCAQLFSCARQLQDVLDGRAPI